MAKVKLSLVDVVNANTIRDFLTAKNSLQLPAGNLGIERRSMPQIKDFKKFERILKGLDISVRTEKLRVSDIRLAQNEVNKDKVFKMMLDYRKLNRRSRGGIDFPGFPPVVTSDGYVLDGLHRQVAMYNINKHAYHNYTVIGVSFREIYDIIRLDIGTFFGVVEYKGLV